MNKIEQPKRRSSMMWITTLITCAFVLFGQATTAMAQATNTFPSSGNAGVGTTTPAVPLHVSGDNDYTSATNPINSQVRISGATDPNMRLVIGYNTTSNFGYIQATQAGTAFRNLALNPLGGNVGIGTTNPGARLDIIGNNIPFGGQLRLAASDYAQITFFKSNNLALNDTGRKAAIFYNLYTSQLVMMNTNGGSYDGPVLLNPDGGSIGIGTYSPSYKLDVQGGQINASGGLCIAGDCKTSWSQVGSGGSSQWTTSGANIYYNSGNVGVGTTAPGVKFAVGGAGGNIYNTDLWVENNLHVQGNETITQGGGRGRMRIGTAWGYMGLYAESSSAGSANDLVLGAGSGYVRVGPNAGAGAPPMNFIVPNGSIGVGTANPGSKLFIGSGTPAVATLAGLNVALGGNSYVATSNGTINTFIGADTSSYGIVGTLSNHPLGLRANNALAMTVMPSGNVGIGTTNPQAKLDVQGNVSVTGDISATGNIAAKYQDVAEWVPSRHKLAAGTVVVLDPEQSNNVMASASAYDTRVAGVVSAAPGVILGEGGEGKVMVATTGRVKVKVDATRAPIRVGDLLVTSDIAGVAMKSEAVNIGGVQLHRPGTLIGKALEPLAKGSGEILVLLSLQ